MLFLLSFVSWFTVFLLDFLVFGPFLTVSETLIPTGWEQRAPYTLQWFGNLPSPLCVTRLASWFDDTSYSQHNPSSCLFPKGKSLSLEAKNYTCHWDHRTLYYYFFFSLLTKLAVPRIKMFVRKMIAIWICIEDNIHF